MRTARISGKTDAAGAAAATLHEGPIAGVVRAVHVGGENLDAGYGVTLQGLDEDGDVRVTEDVTAGGSVTVALIGYRPHIVVAGGGDAKAFTISLLIEE